MLTNPYSSDTAKQRMIYLYLIEEKSINQIGQKMKCSRQWVDLVLKAANVPIRRKCRPYKSQTRPKTEEQMRKEVEKELGFQRCSSCKLLKRINEDFPANMKYRCKDCNRQHTAKYRESEQGRANQRLWQRANKDKLALYQRRQYHKRKAQREAEQNEL